MIDFLLNILSSVKCFIHGDAQMVSLTKRQHFPFTTIYMQTAFALYLQTFRTTWRFCMFYVARQKTHSYPSFTSGNAHLWQFDLYMDEICVAERLPIICQSISYSFSLLYICWNVIHGIVLTVLFL